MHRLRILGIVREANSLRQCLSAPMTAAQLDELATRVRETIGRIDEILRQHRVTPQHLPSQSRQAYDFLRSFDPRRVQPAVAPSAVQPGAAPLPRESFGFRGLRAFLDQVVENIALAVTRGNINPDSHLHVIRQTAERLNHHLCNEHLGPEHLRTESRVLVGWFRYFSDEQAFHAYVAAVARARLAIEAFPIEQRRWTRPVLVSFRHSSSIYRIRPQVDATRVTLNTPLISFDQNALSLLGCQMMGSSDHRSAITDAMLSDSYQAVAIELENAAGVVECPRGMIHDLGQCFNRVNAAYFAGVIARPRLAWTRRLTGRVFGHYDFIRDQLCVSSTLDRPDVPEFVLDHVMHHELLHKKHGFRWQGNRRHAHTGDFRAEERVFPRFDEADQFLNRLSRSLG